MRQILCYGDSNTWGFNPVDGSRYGRDTRWTGVLQQELGVDYYVIEEGLNGRTTVWDDPLGECRNGRDYLPLCLHSHKPLDLVLIMLGTNDLKARLNLPPGDIAAGAGVLIDIVKRSGTGPKGAAPQVLLVAPPILRRLTNLAQRYAGGTEKSRELAEHYRQVSQQTGAYFVDAAQIVKTSDIDGLHWEPGEHGKFAKAVAEYIKNYIFNKII